MSLMANVKIINTAGTVQPIYTSSMMFHVVNILFSSVFFSVCWSFLCFTNEIMYKNSLASNVLSRIL